VGRSVAHPVARPLAELDGLERAHLHVWVAGPGTGEGIAIALPGRGWILIDGCRTGRDDAGEELPLRHILRRFRGVDDPVELMVLTHPHNDHADGFGELLVGERPARVALASPAGPVERTLLAIYEDADVSSTADAEAERRRSQVATAMRAIRTWQGAPGREVSCWHDGASLTLGEVEVRVHAPTSEQLSERLRELTLGDIGLHANAMSLVIEVVYGDCTLLLGGDLPVTHGGTVVPEGWRSVLTRHPHLKGAHRLKVPHHGSREALHEQLLATSHAACWWITPFSAQGLPRGQDPAEGVKAAREGMAQLLDHQPRVQVTSLPTARARQRHVPMPGQVTQSQWSEAFVARDLGGVFAGLAVEVGPPASVRPSEAVWGAAFTREGEWVQRWRGTVALEVVRDAETP
jgi:beta-lactamase superfamily II metal-dependent hydrolase